MTVPDLATRRRAAQAEAQARFDAIGLPRGLPTPARPVPHVAAAPDAAPGLAGPNVTGRMGLGKARRSVTTTATTKEHQ